MEVEVEAFGSGYNHALFRPVLLEETLNYYHGLEYLHSSLHFAKIVRSDKYNFEEVNK